MGWKLASDCKVLSCLPGLNHNHSSMMQVGIFLLNKQDPQRPERDSQNKMTCLIMTCAHKPLGSHTLNSTIQVMALVWKTVNFQIIATFILMQKHRLEISYQQHANRCIFARVNIVNRKDKQPALRALSQQHALPSLRHHVNMWCRRTKINTVKVHSFWSHRRSMLTRTVRAYLGSKCLPCEFIRASEIINRRLEELALHFPKEQLTFCTELGEKQEWTDML